MESEQRNLFQIKKIIIICNKGSLEIMLELVVQFFPRKPTCTLRHSATAAPCFLSYLSCQQWIMFLFVGLSVRLSLRDAFSMCNSLQCFQLFSPKNRTHIRTRIEPIKYLAIAQRWRAGSLFHVLDVAVKNAVLQAWGILCFPASGLIVQSVTSTRPRPIYYLPVCVWRDSMCDCNAIFTKACECFLE